MTIIKQWSTRQWQDLIILTLFFIICYGLFAGSHPILINDEGRYNEIAREMFISHNFITPTNNGVLFLDKPPLFYWLQTSSFWLFGVNEWSVRLWPMIFGCFGCIVTYTTAFYLYNRRAAYLSFAILATSPLYFIYSHYANLDVEVAVLIAASLMGFMLAVRDGCDKPYIKSMLFSYICAGLAFMAKGLMGLVFPVMIIGVWVLCFNQWRLLRHMYLGWGLLIILAICLPWLISIQIQNPEFLKYFFYVQQFERFTGAQFNNPEPITFYFTTIITGLLPWTIWLLQSIKLSMTKIYRQNDYLAAFILLWISLIILFFSIPVSKINSYILPIFPALALLIGRYIAEKDLIEPFWKWIFYIVSLLIIIAAVILGLLPNKFFNHYDVSRQAQILGGILMGCFGIFSFLLFYFLKPTQRWFGLIIWMAVGLAFVNLAETNFHSKPTIKPLVMLINQHLIPQDEIVAYKKYYYDLPFYTQRQVTVVADWYNPAIKNNDSWSGQFANLLAYQPQARTWLITEGQFWLQWHSQKRLFVFLMQNKLSQFQLIAKPLPVYIIGCYDRSCVISNQPLK